MKAQELHAARDITIQQTINVSPQQLPRKASVSEQMPGWILLDNAFLDLYAHILSEDDILRYFDGLIPNWGHALSPHIHPRLMVNELLDHLEQNRQQGGLHVTRLSGPGGEGKSTVLMQTLCRLVREQPGWNILWHDDPQTGLSVEYIEHLPATEQTWLIASDDADWIAEDINAVIKAIHKRGRRDIQLLICYRITDWIAVNGEKYSWDMLVTSSVSKTLRGLSQKDAMGIVKKWSRYNKAGMKKLYGIGTNNAALELFKAAQSEMFHKTYEEEGAFLGALLKVRLGSKGLRSYVQSLLKRMDEQPSVSNKKLSEVFGYIAAPHSRNILTLSKHILAVALGCDVGMIQKYVIGPLATELGSAKQTEVPSLASSSRYILVRHRVIAEVAVDILAQTFNIDFDPIYLALVTAAERVARDRIEFVRDLHKWRYLSGELAKEGKVDLAIQLASALVDLVPQDSYFVSKLGEILRETGHPEQSAEMLRIVAEKIRKRDRVFWYELGTSEGVAGRASYSVWLIGISLADETEARAVDNVRAKISLNGLSIAFYELFKETDDALFSRACSAAVQLGFIPDTTAETERTEAALKHMSARIGSVERAAMSTEIAFATIQEGIVAAWKRVPDEPPQWISPGDSLTFWGLARVLNIAPSDSSPALKRAKE